MNADSSLGARTLSGFIWHVGGTVLGKVFTFSTRIAVLWFLTAEEVGIATWAESMCAFVALNGGMIIPILVQQGPKLEEVVSDGFWLALGFTVAGTLGILLLSPVAAYVYATPTLIPLMFVLALTRLAYAPTPVALARVRVQLRFRLDAGMTLVGTVVFSATMLASAVGGAGPYALVLPGLAQAVVITGAYGAMGFISRPASPARAGIGQLMGPSLWIAAFGIVEGMRTYGMNLTLGGLRDASTTGIFVSGFGIAGQTVFLLAENLRRVLFPSLVAISDDPVRRENALLRVTRLLMLVVPIGCVLQAYVGTLLVPLLPERWSACAPVIFWLSLGLASQPLSLVASSSFLSDKRNRELAIWTAVQAATSAAGVAAGAVLTDGIDGVSIGAAVGIVLGNLGAFAGSRWRKGLRAPGLRRYLGSAPVVVALMCLSAELSLGFLSAFPPVAAAGLQALELAFVAVCATRLLAADDLRELLERTRMRGTARALRLG